ncbi:MAG: acyl-CoA thioesterase [Planctomycetota bacterium]|nr:MAG: acyl-CoA thioesterase [Planctomycetota bacterium]
MTRISRRGLEGIDPSWDQLSIPLRVRFNEVDSMNVVWHGHYVAYCETAREVYLGARGLSYQAMELHDCPAPVVRMQLDYLRPARSGEELQVTCAQIPGGEPKLECRYEVRNGAGELCCIANSLQLFVDATGLPYLTPPPPVAQLFSAIAAARAARPAANPDAGP